MARNYGEAYFPLAVTTRSVCRGSFENIAATLIAFLNSVVAVFLVRLRQQAPGERGCPEPTMTVKGDLRVRLSEVTLVHGSRLIGDGDRLWRGDAPQRGAACRSRRAGSGGIASLGSGTG